MRQVVVSPSDQFTGDHVRVARVRPQVAKLKGDENKEPWFQTSSNASRSEFCHKAASWTWPEASDLPNIAEGENRSIALVEFSDEPGGYGAECFEKFVALHWAALVTIDYRTYVCYIVNYIRTP